VKAVRVKVRYFSFFQDLTGKAEEYVSLHDPSVGGLVDFLEKHYGNTSGNRKFRIRSNRDRLECMIVVNGKSEDLGCALRENDEVSFLQPMGGG